MDYKYIEQLLERYWQCETSLAEEEILRAFFSQDNVPQHLSQYAPLFAGSRAQRQVAALGDDFDSRILAMTEERPAPVKARTVTLRSRFMPLFKAAAAVAIFLTLGNAAQVAFKGDAKPEAGVAAYGDTQAGPSVALGDTAKVDTLQADKPTANVLK